LEKRLAEIWCALLGVALIGIYDNFFDLGGHSLLAAQLLASVREMFRVDVLLGTFIAQPTIAAMALNILELQANNIEQGELNRSVADVERLSEEEAERLLREEKDSADHTVHPGQFASPRIGK
jgi:hypothetical protein